MPSASFIHTLLIMGEIIFVDLILSGDNALVIGAAASFIPRDRRWLALGLGGVGAILLRILFTTSATFLLQIPYLKAIGGLLVLVISVRLLADNETKKEEEEIEQGSSVSGIEKLPSLALRFSHLIQNFTYKRISVERMNLLMAIGTIIIADISMSLDNIVAIGALAKGQVSLLIIGLIFSIVLLMLGSALACKLIEHIPGLIILASVVLALVSADLIWADVQNLPFIKSHWLSHPMIYVFAFAGVIFYVLRIPCSWLLRHCSGWIKPIVRHKQISTNKKSNTTPLARITKSLLIL